MNARKALTWIGIALVVSWVLWVPSDASGVVHSAFSGIENAANALANFVKHMSGAA